MSRLEEGGRVAPDTMQSPYERALLARHIFAYSWVAENFIWETDQVLEIGCGEGYGGAILAKKAARVTALDPGKDAVAHAAAKYAASNLEFIALDGDRLPFRDGEFDKVVSFQVIEHVQDPEAFLKEAARVLKPGGRLYLTTPNRAHRLKEGQKPWYKFHLREYSAAQLAELVSRHFSRCEVGFINVPPDHFQMEMKVARLASFAQRWDPLELRNLIPFRIKQLVFALISPAGGGGGGAAAGTDFAAGKEDRNGLDLWAEAAR